MREGEERKDGEGAWWREERDPDGKKGGRGCQTVGDQEQLRVT